jgi:hypothetical protein
MINVPRLHGFENAHRCNIYEEIEMQWTEGADMRDETRKVEVNSLNMADYVLYETGARNPGWVNFRECVGIHYDE